MAASDLHVNGPAKVQVNFGSSWVDLGYTENGVDVRLEELNEDVFSDEFGPSVPADVAYLGETAELVCSFISWDITNMENVEARFRSAKTLGAVPTNCIGTLYFAGTKYFGVRYLASTRCGLTAERYRQFDYAMAPGSISFTVGTRVTRRQITFRAIPRSGVLYTLVSQ